MELKNLYLSRVLKLFVVLFFIYAVFRLNVSRFFELKESEQEKSSEISLQEKILQTAHVGILFENRQKHTAIFILPDDNLNYDISDFVSEYENHKEFKGQDLQENTIYLSKLDTSCINENNCGENFESIIKTVQQYKMLPKTYDLTKNTVLEN